MRASVVLFAIALSAAAPVEAQSTSTLASRTTLPAHVMCADVLVSVLPVPALRIKGTHHSALRLTMSRGDLAVVARTPGDGLAVGQRFLVRRMPMQSQLDNFRDGGYLSIRTPGWVTIAAMDEVNAMARVDYSCDAIEPDDYLEPYAEVSLPTAEVATLPPDFNQRVRVLPGVDGRELFANGDTFSIASGTEHGMTLGARFAIYRDRKDGKPLVHIGDAIVTDPSATTSKLLLITTTDAVDIRDIAVPRR